jgi:hypothetical protein
VDQQTGPKHALKQGWGVLVLLTRPDDRRLLPPNLVRQKSVGWFYLVHRFIENGVHHNILQPGNLDVFGKFLFIIFAPKHETKSACLDFFYGKVQRRVESRTPPSITNYLSF